VLVAKSGRGEVSKWCLEFVDLGVDGPEEVRAVCAGVTGHPVQKRPSA
jgi:hypothetical protein